MGAPENPEEYVRFEAGDLTVYVARDVLGRLESGAAKQRFYFDGYGGFWLVLAKPWVGLNGALLDF